MSDVRSSAEKTMITREQAFSIIKEAGMKSRDLKLVSDCLEKDEKYQRHIVSPRTTSNSWYLLFRAFEGNLVNLMNSIKDLIYLCSSS